MKIYEVLIDYDGGDGTSCSLNSTFEKAVHFVMDLIKKWYLSVDMTSPEITEKNDYETWKWNVEDSISTSALYISEREMD
jgi:hypothetical protein